VGLICPKEEAAAAKKAQEEAAAAAKAEAAAKKTKEEAAAAKAAEEAQAAKKAAEEAAAKKAEEEAAAAKAAEEARKKAEEEAKRKAEEEARLKAIRAEEKAKAAERAKEEAEAQKVKDTANAKAQEELDALVSRTAEIKERAKSFGGRIKSIDFSKVLPSADEIGNATVAITKFVSNPQDAANSLKSREESNPDLIKVFAGGAANAIVDGVGAGFELVDAVRSDEELLSVVGDAFENAGTAITTIAKSEDDNVERKLKIAFLALDSLGMAAYASICGLVGYSQSGTPVFDAASKAAQGFVQAISALASLAVRSFDLVAEGYSQGQEVAERAMQQEQNDTADKPEQATEERKPAVDAAPKISQQ
jgi:chemotaxis protein histidine kinase CheA